MGTICQPVANFAPFRKKNARSLKPRHFMPTFRKRESATIKQKFMSWAARLGVPKKPDEE